MMTCIGNDHPKGNARLMEALRVLPVGAGSLSTVLIPKKNTYYKSSWTSTLGTRRHAVSVTVQTQQKKNLRSQEMGNIAQIFPDLLVPWFVRPSRTEFRTESIPEIGRNKYSLNAVAWHSCQVCKQ
jgi:hypothetical protein